VGAVDSGKEKPAKKVGGQGWVMPGSRQA